MKLLSDKTFTAHVISNIHSNKSDLCDSIIFEIWPWGEDNNIWITVFLHFRKGEL